MDLWLHHTALAHGFCVSRKGGTVEEGGITHRVTYTWWLQGWAVKGPWLGPGGPILAPAA